MEFYLIRCRNPSGLQFNTLATFKKQTVSNPGDLCKMSILLTNQCMHPFAVAAETVFYGVDIGPA
jgi:hypothetical protein